MADFTVSDCKRLNNTTTTAIVSASLDSTQYKRSHRVIMFTVQTSRPSGSEEAFKINTRLLGVLPAGACPPLVSIFSFGGDDMSAPLWSLQRQTNRRLWPANSVFILPAKNIALHFQTGPSTWLLPEHCLETMRNDITLLPVRNCRTCAAWWRQSSQWLLLRSGNIWMFGESEIIKAWKNKMTTRTEWSHLDCKQKVGHIDG